MLKKNRRDPPIAQALALQREHTEKAMKLAELAASIEGLEKADEERGAGPGPGPTTSSSTLSPLALQALEEAAGGDHLHEVAGSPASRATLWEQLVQLRAAHDAQLRLLIDQHVGARDERLWRARSAGPLPGDDAPGVGCPQSVEAARGSDVSFVDLKRAAWRAAARLSDLEHPVGVVADASATALILGQQAVLARLDPEKSAIFAIDLGAIVRKFVEWRALLPRVRPFYAVKCNPDRRILAALAATGDCGFDCASLREMDEVLRLGVPPDRIVFANPCKGSDHLAYARRQGVRLMTFDSESELRKLRLETPDARLLLRLLVDDSGALMRFGTKFGADPAEARHLIRLCAAGAEAGLGQPLVGVSFHVGSGCQTPQAFGDALLLARAMWTEAARVGIRLTVLDIGGGFPGTADALVAFPEIAEVVNRSLDELWPDEMAAGPDESDFQVIAEPGRYFVAASHVLALRVVSRRDRLVPAGEVPGAAPALPETDPSEVTREGASRRTSISSLGTEPLFDVDDAHLSSSLGDEQHAAGHDDADGAGDDAAADDADGNSVTSGSCSSGPGGDDGTTDPSVDQTLETQSLYYFSDGVYGSFNGVIFDHQAPVARVLALPGDQGGPAGRLYKSWLFGPTCDSMDRISSDAELPRLEIGDWLYFEDMGAYTTAAASSFNGFQPPARVYVIDFKEK